MEVFVSDTIENLTESYTFQARKTTLSSTFLISSRVKENRPVDLNGGYWVTSNVNDNIPLKNFTVKLIKQWNSKTTCNQPYANISCDEIKIVLGFSLTP